MVPKTTPKKSAGEDPVYAQAVQNYEAGLRSIQEHKYEKARTHLQKVVAAPTESWRTALPFTLISAASISTRRPTSSRTRKSISTTPFR